MENKLIRFSDAELNSVYQQQQNLFHMRVVQATVYVSCLRNPVQSSSITMHVPQLRLWHVIREWRVRETLPNLQDSVTVFFLRATFHVESYRKVYRASNHTLFASQNYAFTLRQFNCMHSKFVSACASCSHGHPSICSIEARFLRFEQVGEETNCS